MGGVVPNAEVVHAVAASSDHVPLVLDCSPRPKGMRSRQFRYEVMWNREGGFKNILRESWVEARRGSPSFCGMAKGCGEALDRWNRSVFGRVRRRLGEWKRRLEIIRDQPRSEENCREEARIKDSINEWLAKEEILWKQRAKADWLREVLGNSKFFKSKASQRRRNNFIKEVRLEDGAVVTEEGDKLKAFEDYFSSLFAGSEHVDEINWQSALEGWRGEWMWRRQIEWTRGLRQKR